MADANAERHVLLVVIIDAYRDKKPPSSPRDGELEGSMLVGIIGAFPGKKSRPPAPRGEPEGGQRVRSSP